MTTPTSTRPQTVGQYAVVAAMAQIEQLEREHHARVAAIDRQRRLMFLAIFVPYAIFLLWAVMQ